MASDRNMQHDPERSESLLIPYGVEYQGASVLPSSADEPFLRIELDGRVINTNLVGSYNADNVMAAIAVGKQFGVSLDEAVKAIESYVPSNNRSQMTRTDRNTLIVDAYNANPTSMAAALENFSNVSASVKMAMLGDMLELGDDSLAEHIAVIKSVASRGLSKTFFVGKEFAAASEAVLQHGSAELTDMQFFATSDQLTEHLAELQLTGATILIKGSRGTRMEKVVPFL
jgi:UDP-N-acetylmuramoyl-tripeptide--D-alanyl-D-alanine ligase